MNDEDVGIFDGSVKPENIPEDWVGEPLPDNQGWRWFNPIDRTDSVRFYSGDEPYVIVTAKGKVIGRNGEPTGEYLDD